jgi:predicted small lipoprotein YifL
MKKLLALILAFAMVFALCACGSQGGTAAPGEHPNRG